MSTIHTCTGLHIAVFAVVVLLLCGSARSGLSVYVITINTPTQLFLVPVPVDIHASGY